MQEFQFKPIAIAKTCYPEKFGIPRQAGLVPSARAQLHFIAPYNNPDAVGELTQCSHLWVQFVFHENKHHQWRPKVRPPRLGGNQSVGVFATRSPYRPNPIGLSVVALDRVECHGGAVILHVSGVDLLDGTPILDVKPYVPYTDCLPYASNAIAPHAPECLSVEISTACDGVFKTMTEDESEHLQQLIVESLQQDPRPSYHALNESREYGMVVEGYNIRWRYKDLASTPTAGLEPVDENLLVQVFSIQPTSLG